jgi:branched-chain amino acid transport system permease protein
MTLLAGARERVALRGRPDLYTSYRQDMAMFNTPGKRLGVGLLLALALFAPFFFRDDVVLILALGVIAAIGAIGLNLVTGYAGQVSLGHAFFLGLGAYTAAVLGGAPNSRTVALGLPMIIWLPAAGAVSALAGLIVGPLAVRLRGLYLAIVTLGLVFLGGHIFKEARSFTGGVGVGRPGAQLVVFGQRFDQPGPLLFLDLTRAQKQYLLGLFFLIVFAWLGRNIARSSVGRAFSAVRDRDIAAEVIGVPLTKYKVMAFTISSFYAGVAGALYFAVVGFFEPASFSLLLSIQYIAMVLIGGVATISGSIMGALFITSLGRITQELAHYFPFISPQAGSTQGLLTVFQLEAILYGLLIIGFLIFEPRGLFGIWFRMRNYWKGWPFSY